jgi:hypothetical protein
LADRLREASDRWRERGIPEDLAEDRYERDVLGEFSVEKLFSDL